MSQKYRQEKKKQAQKKKRVRGPRLFTKPVHLICRLCVLALVATAAVIFTDRKHCFITDQQDPHHERRWDAIYDLIPDFPIDIVVLGNSHVNTGIDPFALSCTLGCTAFDLAPSGITIADAYYCLKEMLAITTPRLVVVETYLMRGTDGPILEGEGLADEFRSFYPRRNTLIKIESLPVLFGVESYLPAWSSTLRNHELLLRNREEMKKNREMYEKRHSQKDDELYLGRFARFTSGINDSIARLYETNGPAVDGGDEIVSKRDMKYARKIVDLCRENGVEVMFLTLPMHEKHVGNYELWRDEQAKAIDPTGAPWYNLQMPYLPTFDYDCFEPTYDKNQHMTMQGALKATYKLAHYIVDEMKVDLPDRREESVWYARFYGKNRFYENLPPRITDEKVRLIAKDAYLDGEHIIEMLQTETNWLYLKLERNSMRKDTVELIAGVVMNGERVAARIPIVLSRWDDPVHHKLYTSRLLDDITVEQLLDWY